MNAQVNAPAADVPMALPVPDDGKVDPQLQPQPQPQPPQPQRQPQAGGAGFDDSIALHDPDFGDPTIEQLERALTINEAKFGPNHVNIAVTLEKLGNTYRELGDAAKAGELLERARLIVSGNYST